LDPLPVFRTQAVNLPDDFIEEQPGLMLKNP
jgi:hypothetical protein